MQSTSFEPKVNPEYPGLIEEVLEKFQLPIGDFFKNLEEFSKIELYNDEKSLLIVKSQDLLIDNNTIRSIIERKKFDLDSIEIINAIIIEFINFGIEY